MSDNIYCHECNTVKLDNLKWHHIIPRDKKSPLICHKCCMRRYNEKAKHEPIMQLEVTKKGGASLRYVDAKNKHLISELQRCKRLATEYKLSMCADKVFLDAFTLDAEFDDLFQKWKDSGYESSLEPKVKVNFTLGIHPDYIFWTTKRVIEKDMERNAQKREIQETLPVDLDTQQKIDEYFRLKALNEERWAAEKIKREHVYEEKLKHERGLIQRTKTLYDAIVNCRITEDTPKISKKDWFEMSREFTECIYDACPKCKHSQCVSCLPCTNIWIGFINQKEADTDNEVTL